MRQSAPTQQASRAPLPALSPFVELLWASGGGATLAGGGRRELVLPTGSLHIVVRLDDRPLRVFRGAADAGGLCISGAVIGGARSAPYLKDSSGPDAAVGALLRPGAAGLLIGVPAGAFSGAHTPLEDVWGAAAVERLRSRLAEVTEPARRLALFEAALLSRLPPVRHIDPRIASALAYLRRGATVGAAAAECALSHRHFTKRFRESVGLAPKAWCRVLRFGRALDHLTAEPEVSWAELAAAEGYADQAHFVREFRDLSGLTPGEYRRRAPAAPRHVPFD